MTYYKNRLFIVFGASGVGKTRVCLDYAAAKSNTLYVSASSLLKAATGLASEQLRTLPKRQIGSNQRLLFDSLDRVRRETVSDQIILDAHAVIDNGDSLVPVSIDIVRAMIPDGFILIEPPVDQVYMQKLNDGRQRHYKTLFQIAQEMRAERSTVTNYSSILNVDMIVITDPSAHHFAKAIDQITDKKHIH